LNPQCHRGSPIPRSSFCSRTKYQIPQQASTTYPRLGAHSRHLEELAAYNHHLRCQLVTPTFALLLANSYPMHPTSCTLICHNPMLSKLISRVRDYLVCMRHEHHMLLSPAVALVPRKPLPWQLPQLSLIYWIVDASILIHYAYYQPPYHLLFIDSPLFTHPIHLNHKYYRILYLYSQLTNIHH